MLLADIGFDTYDPRGVSGLQTGVAARMLSRVVIERDFTIAAAVTHRSGT